MNSQATHRGRTGQGFVSRLLALVLLVVAFSASAQAANLVVNSLADADPPAIDSACTLREAITAANNDANFQDCSGAGSFGADTITFSVTGTIMLASTLPTVTDADALTIDGPGAANLTISGNNAVRVLSVNAGATLELRNLTISNGATGQRVDGAGINNSGTLTIRNCTLSANVAGEASSGGAIFSTGALTIVDSMISGNSANQGGAVSSRAGSVTIKNSTLSDNRAVTANPTGSSEGGAIFSFGTLTIGNSTVSGNSAKQNGGIKAGGTVTITNSTVSGNVPTNLDNGGGEITLMNSIVAGALENCTGTFIDGGGNLDDAGSCGFTAPTSKANTPAGLDPAGLKDNGGPTQTIALCTGVDTPTGCTGISAAIDMAKNDVCAAPPVNNKDQRGFDRPKDGDGNGSAICDIGAFEVQPPSLTCNGKPVTIKGTPGNDNLAGTNGDDVIAGLGGHDNIAAGGGNDTVCGGEGNDNISGGNGNDWLSGEGGRDNLSGGDGNDTLLGGADRDNLSGGNGTDTLDGGADSDNCSGGAGADTGTACEPFAQ